MSNAAALIAALHTAGGHRGRYVTEWLALAQSDSALCEAFRQVFGKRLPTPQKFGLWITEHVGACGGLILETRYNAKRKAWAARVTTPEHAAAQRVERERVAAELDARRAAAATERAERDNARRAARLEELKARLPVIPSLKIETAAPEPIAGDVVTDSTGQKWLATQKIVDGRIVAGREAITEKAAAPTVAPAVTKPEPPVQSQPNDQRPPWLQRGDSGPKDRAEWLAWQTHRTAPGAQGESHPVAGWADSGGVVAGNVSAEQGGRRYCHVSGRWPGRVF